MKVFLDPGHGGYDSGAVGDAYKESGFVLEDAMAVAALLIKAGVAVKLSRNSDKFVGLNQRVAAANIWGADAFISFHINSALAKAATGSETFYYRERSRGLAEKLQQTITNTLYLADRGVKRKGFVVIKSPQMPAVLMEPFFIQNPHDLNRYLDCRDRLRVNIARTVLDYVGVKPKKEIAMHQTDNRLVRWRRIGWPNVSSVDTVIVGNPHPKDTVSVWVRWNRGDSKEIRLVPSQSIELPKRAGYLNLRSRAIIDSELRLG